MRRRPCGGRAAAALGGVLMLVGAGLGAATTWAHAPVVTTDVRVVTRDFSYTLSRRNAPVGRVRFTVVNRGDIGHDFAIGGKKTRILGPGKSVTLDDVRPLVAEAVAVGRRQDIGQPAERRAHGMQKPQRAA